MKDKRIKYSCNHDTFSCIDTEEKAYWLGMLYTDGCIESGSNRIDLGLQKRDCDHVIKFADFLKYTGPVECRKISGEGKQRQDYYRVRISSPKMKSDLIKLGCIPKKSLILKYPTREQISSEFIYHFIRGCFDGDGSINLIRNREIEHYPNIQIKGTKELLQGIIDDLGISRTLYKAPGENNTYDIRYSGDNAVIVLRKLYENSSVSLQRKYDKYLQSINYKAYAVNYTVNTIWINNGKELSRINKSDIIPDGWFKGIGEDVRKKRSPNHVTI